MCGRFTLISSMLQLNEHFKLISKYGGVLVSRYNIAPGKSIPIIINRCIEFVNWGVQLLTPPVPVPVPVPVLVPVPPMVHLLPDQSARPA